MFQSLLLLLFTNNVWSIHYDTLITTEDGYKPIQNNLLIIYKLKKHNTLISRRYFIINHKSVLIYVAIDVHILNATFTIIIDFYHIFVQ